MTGEVVKRQNPCGGAPVPKTSWENGTGGGVSERKFCFTAFRIPYSSQM